MEKWITYVSAVIVVIGVTLTAMSKIKDRREARRGWRISYEPFGIRYYEKKDVGWVSLLIRATCSGHFFDKILIPSETIWRSRHPQWAQARREEIVSRIQSESPALSFVEEPIQPPESMAGLAPGHGSS